MAAITGAVIAGTAGLAGAAAGIASAVKGSKDQTQTTTTSTGPKSAAQQELEKQSMQNYQAQQGLAGAYERGIDSAQGLQDQARSGISGILSGESMNLSPQEQANIQAIRQAMVAQGSDDINSLLDRRLAASDNSAAARGVRGIAQQQLTGDALRTAAAEQGNLSQQANLYAAQQATALPYQRIAAQSPYLQQGMTLADQMRIQAQQNRQMLQSPYLLQLEQQSRMGTQATSTPGQSGGWSDGVVAGLGGLSSGLTAGSNIYGSFNNLMPKPKAPTGQGQDIGMNTRVQTPWDANDEVYG